MYAKRKMRDGAPESGKGGDGVVLNGEDRRERSESVCVNGWMAGWMAGWAGSLDGDRGWMGWMLVQCRSRSVASKNKSKEKKERKGKKKEDREEPVSLSSRFCFRFCFCFCSWLEVVRRSEVRQGGS